MRVFRFLTLDNLYSLPDPTWLIDQILMDGSLVMLFGNTGIGKTFLSLDMALCIATGLAWHGHRVQQGPILYVLSEGIGGAKVRVKAWDERYGPIPEEHFMFLPERIDFSNDGETSQFIAALGPYRRPRLIVIDTLRRNMTGNENIDIAPVIANFDRVRQQLQTTVLFNHHPALNTSRPRGSTDTPASVDSSFYLSRVSPTTLKLECQKHRETALTEPILFEKQSTASYFGMSLTLSRVGARPPQPVPVRMREEEGEVQEGEEESARARAKLLARFAATGSLDGWETDASRRTYQRVKAELRKQGKWPAVH